MFLTCKLLQSCRINLEVVLVSCEDDCHIRIFNNFGNLWRCLGTKMVKYIWVIHHHFSYILKQQIPIRLRGRIPSIIGIINESGPENGFRDPSPFKLSTKILTS